MTTLPRDNGYGCGIRVTEERERSRGGWGGREGGRRRVAEAESEAETGGAPVQTIGTDTGTKRVSIKL